MGLKSNERPQIRRSNIVCAEPMPGDQKMLEEYLGTLHGNGLEALMRKAWHVPPDQRVKTTPHMADALTKLVRTVWQDMELAGEAGSLLKIEETLREAITTARKESEEKSPLFRVLEFGLNESSEEHYVQLLSEEDQDFFDRTEGLVVIALREYTEQAVNGRGYQRRLFAGDVSEGFDFINLMRKHYDVVLMNPPFSEASSKTVDYCEKNYTSWNRNLLCCFLERMNKKSETIASVYDRTIAIKTTYQDFRKIILLSQSHIFTIADLGWGVLDANVEVSTIVMSSNKFANFVRNELFFDVKN